jgi:hypothetical protein
MRLVQILQDCFARVADLVPTVLDGLRAEDERGLLERATGRTSS